MTKTETEQQEKLARFDLLVHDLSNSQTLALPVQQHTTQTIHIQGRTALAFFFSHLKRSVVQHEKGKGATLAECRLNREEKRVRT
jgi:hypothetical protein